MEIRHSTMADFERVTAIYDAARRFMVAHGNPNQWSARGWPPEDVIRADLESENGYVCLSGGEVVGAFFFRQGKDIDPTYRVIEGRWLNDEPYGVIHRLASDGSVKGVGAACIDWAMARCDNLRIDTHGDNKVMQNLLSKKGFVYCGIIHVAEDNDPRLAYQKVSER